MKFTNKMLTVVALLVFIAIAILLVGFRTFAEVTPNPDSRYAVNKELNLGEFKSISSYKGEWRIYITKADSISVIISGGENLINNFAIVELDGDTLKLDIKDEFKYYSMARVILRITMPEIDRIMLTGNSNLRILDSSFPTINVHLSDYSTVLVDSCSIGESNVYASGNSGIKYYRSKTNELNYRMYDRTNLLSDNAVKYYNGELNDTSYANINEKDIISNGMKKITLKLNFITGLLPYKDVTVLDSILRHNGTQFLTDTIKSNIPMPVNLESYIRKSELLSYAGGELFGKPVKYWNFDYSMGLLSQVTLFFNAMDESTYSCIYNSLAEKYPDSTKVTGLPDFTLKPEKINMWGFKDKRNTRTEIVSLEQDNSALLKLNYSIFYTGDYQTRIDPYYTLRYSADRIWEKIINRIVYGSNKDFMNRMPYGF